MSCPSVGSGFFLCGLILPVCCILLSAQSFMAGLEVFLEAGVL